MTLYFTKWCALLAAALPSLEVPRQILDSDLQEEFSTTDVFAEESGYSVIRAYLRIQHSDLPERESLTNIARLHLSNNERFKFYLLREIDHTPNTFATSGKRKVLFDILGQIPAEWAVEKLGTSLQGPPMAISREELEDPDLDYDGIDNRHLAAWGLERLVGRNSDALVASMDGRRLPRWTEWWQLNSGREKVIAQELQSEIEVEEEARATEPVTGSGNSSGHVSDAESVEVSAYQEARGLPILVTVVSVMMLCLILGGVYVFKKKAGKH